MKTNIIRIDSSQEARIPKILLEQSRLGTEVDLEVENEMIVIRRAARPRKGWAEKFRLMPQSGDDKMIDEDLSEQITWDEDEWEW